MKLRALLVWLLTANDLRVAAAPVTAYLDILRAHQHAARRCPVRG